MATSSDVIKVCERVAVAKWPKVEKADSSKASLLFESGHIFETTVQNAARSLLQNHKFSIPCGSPTPFGYAEHGFCEHLITLATNKNTFDDLMATLVKLLNKMPYRFLIDPKSLTLADLVVFEAMKAQKDVPCEVSRWIAFVKMHIDNLTENKPDSEASKEGNVETENLRPTNFIKQIIEQDLKDGKVKEVVTRFPPEPNGYLHLGHAKSIYLNFGLAQEFKGRCHLRFDDTNPEKEDMRYINSIIEDVKWLGGDWGKHLYYASDYFGQLYDWAVQLIRQGDAYVDSQTEEEVRLGRGDLLTPGKDSPYRTRSVQDNIHLFELMRDRQIPEGGAILRAKINMAHGNMHLRDPPIYRIRFHDHPRTGNKWCIYPIYDFAHGQCDSIEKITHSICTIEFEDHRPLYEWFQEKLGIFKTRQIEFARLNCTHVVMSKRKLMDLVSENHVADWDDPRLPTISGMRRRGYPAAAIKEFCDRIGVAKRANTIGFDYLERCIENLVHPKAYRRMVILKPLKVIITNFPKNNYVEDILCPNHPEMETLGSRTNHFSEELYIDRDDFMVNPPPNYFRLAVGKEVRLRYGYWIKACNYKTDSSGNVTEVQCTYDPSTKAGKAPTDGRKVKGTIHWVASVDAIDAEIRIYDKLFTTTTPDVIPEGKVWQDSINPLSLRIYRAKAERSLAEVVHPSRLGGIFLQFERIGYFVADYDTTSKHPIFNSTIMLTDSWAAQTDEFSKEAQKKEAQRIARENAALERRKKKDERERRQAEKERGKCNNF